MTTSGINRQSYAYGASRSSIREIAAYGSARKAEIGAQNVYLLPEKPEGPRRPGVNALVATDLELPISHRYRLRASSDLPRLSAANS